MTCDFDKLFLTQRLKRLKNFYAKAVSIVMKFFSSGEQNK